MARILSRCVYVFALVVLGGPLDAARVAAAPPQAMPAGSASGIPCGGDCNGDGAVDISDLVRAVRVVLALDPFESCSAADIDNSADVTINELVVAVNAALSGCTPSAVRPDEFEPDDVADDAKPIACGSIQSRTTAPAGDQDWALFTLDQPFTGVQISASEGAAPIELRGSAGTLLSQDFFGVVRVCGEDALPAGRYRIHVLGGFADVNYQLRLECAPCSQANPTPTPTPINTATPTAAAPDDYEPNDVPTLAATIACGQSQRHTISPLGDIDWLRFTLTEPYSSVVIQTGDPVSFMSVTLASAEGVLFEDANTALSRVCGTDALEAGDYTIRLADNPFQQFSFAYDVALLCTTCDVPNPTPIPTPTNSPTPGEIHADEFEPDNVAEIAGPVACGDVQARTLTFGDVDWLAISVDSPFTGITIAGSGIPLGFHLQTDAGTVLQDEFFSPLIRSCGVDALAAGTYRIAIFAIGDPGQYTMRLDCTPCDQPNSTATPTPTRTATPTLARPDRFEPDNSPQKAQALRCGEIQEHTIAPPHDTDWLTFTVDEPNTAVLIEGIGLTNQITMQLENELGEPIASDFGGGRILRSCGTDALALGTYRLQVWGLAPNERFGYELFLVCGSCDEPNPTPTHTPTRTPTFISSPTVPADAFEPDDAPGQAAPIGCDETQSRSFSPQGDVDNIALTLTAPFSGVRIETIPTVGTSGLFAYLLTTADEIIDSADLEPIVHECDNDALAAGDYRIQLQSFTVSPYSIRVDCIVCDRPNPTPTPTMTATPTPTPPAPDGFEPDGSSETAHLLNCNELQHHSLAPVGDQDWLRLNLTDPHTAVFLQTLTPELLSITLLTADLEVVDQQPTNHVCGVNALTAGEYRVQVEGFFFGGPFAYDIGVVCFPCDRPNQTPTPFPFQ